MDVRRLTHLDSELEEILEKITQEILIHLFWRRIHPLVSIKTMENYERKNFHQ